MFLTLLKFTAVSFCITALIALGLIVSDRPKDFTDEQMSEGLDFESTIARGISDLPDQAHLKMADGWKMPVRRYGAQDASKPLLIMVHGSGWLGLQFNSLANSLSGEAYVVVPDLRGHGASPERRGDVDYINQMEDDLAELITSERQFNMPKAAREGAYGHLATLSYSYRLNTGFAPRMDYLKDVAALPKFMVIVGSADEAFFADQFEPVMSAASDKGSYHIVDGESHLSIVDASATESLIRGNLK